MRNIALPCIVLPALFNTGTGTMKNALFSLIALGSLGFLSADATTFNERLNQDEVRVLRDWINTKRQITVKERGGNLSISGEVVTEFQSKKETRNGIRQLGPSGVFKTKAEEQFDINFKLMLDYRTDRAWIASRLSFDNNMGTISGSLGNIALERAYVGGRLIEGDTYTLDVEMGRRPLGNIFDSRIQFGSLMDGLVVKYNQGLDYLGDAYLYAGPFIIDEVNNHYGYVGELGLLNVGGTGLYMKYSLIDWYTKHYGDVYQTRRYEFVNSQLTMGYTFLVPHLEQPMSIFAAGLINGAAEKLPVTRNEYARLAYYTGFSLGQLRRKGDWSLTADWQWVEAQAVPEVDRAGIGTNNAEGAGFHTTVVGGGGLSNDDPSLARGQKNYKGIEIVFLYLISSNVTLFQSYQHSWTLNKNIGPDVTFRAYELEVVYAF